MAFLVVLACAASVVVAFEAEEHKCGVGMGNEGGKALNINDLRSRMLQAGRRHGFSWGTIAHTAGVDH